MNDKQKTIANEVSVRGIGLHTGQEVSLTFKPAPENHGYKFKRTDIENQPIVDANVDYVVDTSRGTTIEHKGVRVATVEHTLSAVAGLGIDNILIELDCSEPPILDGSAKFYVEALLKAGIVEQDAEKEYFTLRENLSYYDKEKMVEMFAVPSDNYRLSTMIDYETKVLGTQNAHLNRLSDFAEEIAPCRTFVFLHELEYLLSNNLIKGGDLKNAIVFVNRVVSQDELDRLASLFDKPKMAVRDEGILNNLELYHQNEPARHKLLDIVGDLALIGKPLKAHIFANRPGHKSNVEFAKLIKEHILAEASKERAPVVDHNDTPLYNINQIKKFLPHRYPFLLIDKIIEIGETHIIGTKNVTANEEFFNGHFPDEPLMPGVLQIEAMAQVGGMFVLNTVPDPENYLTYFLRIDNAKFRHKVIPGDTLVFYLELKTPIRRGICNMQGKAYVGDKIVMEADLLAQISKKPS
jgi:UDP-3-O-[3-hydroxymyristoyl] N-acetylglucosamine deacetylase / 3-hydroxyacyl-[acyl-carrier-protein] dehydratase